ncbi:MAG: membrane-bound lytic murein transglycosylase MltF [Desulfococcaceae bacterium]
MQTKKQSHLRFTAYFSEIHIRKILICACVCLCLMNGCGKKQSESGSVPHISPLEKILDTGKITLITKNNANCYYQYRDRYIGFEYELALAFADYLGVDLDVLTAENWEEMTEMLGAEPAAFIGAGLHISPEYEKKILFSSPYLSVKPHILARWDNGGICSASDLAGKTVHVPEGSFCIPILESLQKTGISLEIKSVPECDEEELIRRIADGEIEVTLADEHIALLHRRYYPRTVIKDAVGEEISIAWAVRPDAEKLLRRMNAFFRTAKNSNLFSDIYNRYYAEVPPFDFDQAEHFMQIVSEHLPLYYHLIQKVGDEHGFDWHLIAAQIYQESHFNPQARSPAGAVGLMQIVQPTGKSLNITDLTEPEENIEAGVRYLKDLHNFFDRAEGDDRLHIALAAYNIGQGHILDARNIARSKGLDPDKWASLIQTLPLLQHEEYHRKALYGYCRGIEPVEYVTKIMLYSDMLSRRYFLGKNIDKKGFLQGMGEYQIP